MALFQSFIDLKNFILFRKQIKGELEKANSKMTRYNIQRNGLGNILYVQINCNDLDLINADGDEEKMIMNKLKPIIDYLGIELGWSEYLVPQISNFVDEEGNKSLSYGVLFIFEGYSLTMTKFIAWSLINLGILGTGIWALCHYLL